MMRCFFSLFVVLSLLTPLYGETVIFQEDFDGTVGTALTDLGWSGSDNIVISSAIIDSGNSADWADGSTTWPSITKALSYTPDAGEIYTLTATLYAPGTGGEYADVRLINSSDPANQMQGITCGYNDMSFGIINTATTIKVVPQPTTATDVKMVLHGDSTEFFYRANGTSAWTTVGELTGLGFSLSTFDAVNINGQGGLSGGIDSVLVTVTAVPEPSSIMMIFAGMFGLLCTWRKRN